MCGKRRPALFALGSRWFPRRHSSMFRFLGRLTATYPSTICLVWVVAGLALAWLAPTWDSRAVDDDIHFLPQRCASVRGYQLLEEAFPQDIFASRVVLALERA